MAVCVLMPSRVGLRFRGHSYPERDEPARLAPPGCVQPGLTPLLSAAGHFGRWIHQLGDVGVALQAWLSELLGSLGGTTSSARKSGPSSIRRRGRFSCWRVSTAGGVGAIVLCPVLASTGRPSCCRYGEGRWSQAQRDRHVARIRQRDPHTHGIGGSTNAVIHLLALAGRGWGAIVFVTLR
jgi:hypothetical protein